MQPIVVSTAALNQTPLDWNGNVSRIVRAIDEAKRAGSSILCLPELCISGYGCEDAFFSSGLQTRSLELLFRIAKRCRGIVVNVGLPLQLQGALFNAAALIVDGKVAGFVPKKNLAGDGIYYEPRWFKPWPVHTVSKVTIEGEEYPVGDLYFNIGGVRIGFEICEDAWVAERPGIDLAANGVDIILNPSASHFAFGKRSVRRRFVLEGARAFGVTYVYSNLLGCESGRIIFDGDSLIAEAGEIVASTPRFSFDDVAVATATVDLDKSRLQRVRSGSFKPKLGASSRVVDVKGFKLVGKAQPRRAVDKSPAWEGSSAIKEEEFTRAVALGLFDYMRKSRSKGFVVSLSGGIDSSAATCLIRYMAQLGITELGLDQFKAKLSYFEELRACKSIDQVMQKLLTCVYQASAHSTELTHTAAREVAREVRARFADCSIESIVSEYTSLAEAALDENLSWGKHDLALQNIQARVRSPSVWFIANVKNALLLTTSNRSEAAVGYTTMDGDTSGGLSPLGGIDKAFLRQWSKWVEKDGPVNLGPLPSLEYVHRQPPTAELRPSAEKQTDEGDLMPYSVLDRIERLAIRDKMTPLEVWKQLCSDGQEDLAPERLRGWVAKFFRLWSVNQWKRERYAPSFHLDDENLDPKTWCRFPILSGGFAVELEELMSAKLPTVRPPDLSSKRRGARARAARGKKRSGAM